LSRIGPSHSKAREFALGFATSTRDVLADLGLAKQ